jgi:TPR repeat protein
MNLSKAALPFILTLALATIFSLAQAPKVSSATKTGVSQKQSNETRIADLQPKASKGDAKAQFDLAMVYCHDDPNFFARHDDDEGRTCKQKGLPWLKKSANAGYAPAQNDLGVFYEAPGMFGGHWPNADFLAAALEYREASEQGFAISQRNLGELYLHGNGVPRNYNEAAKWILKAADQSNVDAMIDLGELYIEGKGVEQSYAEADQWFKKALNSPTEKDASGWAVYEALGYMSHIGDLYENSEHAPHDYARAFYWTKLAAESRAHLLDSGAPAGGGADMCNLAVMYDLGLGVGKSPQQAEYWYNKFADESNSTNFSKPANEDERQHIVDTNCKNIFFPLYIRNLADDSITPEWSKEWLQEQKQSDWAKEADSARKDADQGVAPAQNELANLYTLGLGVPQDYGMAANLFRKAAEQGFPPSEYMLGKAYLDGRGTPRDYEEAYFWFNLASIGTPTTKKLQAKAIADRDGLVSQIKPAALESVQKRARKWFEEHQNNSQQ